MAIKYITPSAPVLDNFGREVAPGDLLAVAFRSGNTAEIRVGRVEGFAQKVRYPGHVTTVVVDWTEFNKREYDTKVSQIEFDNRRFIKIELPLDKTEAPVV